ncbi:MAG: fumarylacetoacetate hydrolase family protein [Nitrospinota bacterium]
MRLASLRVVGVPLLQERVGVQLSDGRWLDANLAYAGYLGAHGKTARPQAAADAYLPPDMVAIIRGEAGSLSLLRALFDWGEERVSKGEEPLGPNGERVAFREEELRWLPPVPRPGKVIALGLNFRDHLAEGGPLHKEPPFPMGFVKVTSSLVGHREPILVPRDSRAVDYEVELAVVVGARCKGVRRERALEHVFGYTIFNDVSEREIQIPEFGVGLINLGKNLDTFGPMGPWVVTADELSDPDGLELELWVNDEEAPRQRSNTRHLVFDIPRILEHWSQQSLEPGDILTTGTPGGVAIFHKPPDPWYLKPGDVVRARVEGVGVLENPVRQAP